MSADAAVLVAVSASTVTTLTTLWTAARAEKHARKAAEFGQGNSKGTVPDMLEWLMDWAERHDARHAKLETSLLKERVRKTGRI